MTSLKEALTIAKIRRCCPPEMIKNASEHEEFVKRHNSICPYCSTGYGKENPLVINSPVVPGKLIKLEVEAGDIRYIQPALEGWKEGWYFNTSLVVVTDVSDDIDNLITVTLAYADSTLAAPGDLITRTGLLVEAWNYFSFDQRALSARLVGKVTPEELKFLRGEGSLPKEAVLPLPMRENDPRIDFRRLEVSVGFAFQTPTSLERV